MQGKPALLSIRAKAAGYGDEFEAYEDALLGGQLAREELVTRNMGLVQYCVNAILKNKKRLNSLSRDDLVQEGAIGLARAVDKYNPAIGGKFSTYAVYWIRAAVLRCIAERDDILRVPSHVSQAVLEINKAARRLGVDLDGAITTSGAWREAQEAKRLAEEAGLSERNFEEAMKVRYRRYTGGYVAFESWMQKGENMDGDIPVLGGASDESATATFERAQLRKALSKFLRPKEIEALSWRYGLVNEERDEFTPQQQVNQYLADAEEYLFGSTGNQPPTAELPDKGRFGEAMSFNEVGKKMKVSAEYGRRLCHAGLAKLRQAAEDGRLEPALLF
jgi:RNA polymerase sigma factor (sigma-70 family)